MKSRCIRENMVLYGILLISAFTFVLYFSTSTSPLYEGYGSDSAIFQVMGKYWLDGKVPLIDTFDHKGPYIFLVNALGYWLTGTKTGVFLVQVVNMFITIVGIYKIAGLVFKKSNAVVWSIITLGFLGLCYDGGNLTEEYTLPFLAFSIYFQYKFILENQDIEGKEHNWKKSILYGIAFAICFFTRLTNAIGLCSGILIILIILILKKKWKNIIQNIGGVLIGIFVVSLPIFVYYGIKNAVTELMMGTFLLNVNMATSVTIYWWTNPHSIVAWVRILVAHMASYGMIMGGSVLLIKKKQQEAWYYICVGIFMTVYLVTRYAYYHYMIISVPYLPLIASAIARLTAGKKAKILESGFAVVISIFILYQGFNLYEDLWKAKSVEPEYTKYVEMIPEEDRDNFIGYNVKTAMYLEKDIAPYYKYFHHQDYHASRNVYVENELVDVFENGDVKWILYEETANKNCIDAVLQNKYELIVCEGKYSLFCRK